MFRTWRSRLPLLSLVALAVLLIGCPKKPPAAAPAPPPEVTTTVPTPPTAPRVSPEDERLRAAQAQRERGFREGLAAFEGQLVHFDFDRSEIKEEFEGVLRAKADFLKANPNVRTQIEGHADERGTVQYNLALGAQRAESAKAFVSALGVDASRMSTISFGEERPLDPGKTEESYTKNRRARFVVTGQ